MNWRDFKKRAIIWERKHFLEIMTMTCGVCGLIGYIIHPEIRPIINIMLIIAFCLVVAFVIVFCPLLVFITIATVILAAIDFVRRIGRCFQ